MESVQVFGEAHPKTPVDVERAGNVLMYMRKVCGRVCRKSQCLQKREEEDKVNQGRTDWFKRKRKQCNTTTIPRLMKTSGLRLYMERRNSYLMLLAKVILSSLQECVLLWPPAVCLWCGHSVFGIVFSIVPLKSFFSSFCIVFAFSHYLFQFSAATSLRSACGVCLFPFSWHGQGQQHQTVMHMFNLPW